MGKVLQHEVRPGLVVHLDPVILRAHGGSLTTARIVDGKDRSVHEPHYFLILEFDEQAGLWLAAPLFSKWAPGSRRLDERFKGGLAAKWIGAPSHYSAWQMWKIPPAAIEAASYADEASSTDRRCYAIGEESALEDIVRDREDGRGAFRPA